MKVSIPFKREGTCEQIYYDEDGDEEYVSIPFKREGTCEQFEVEISVTVRVEFQFPSNGKARVNEIMFKKAFIGTQFQFPSNGKARVNACCEKFRSAGKPCFNSLQTGRHV